jgi:hypothetical protein
VYAAQESSLPSNERLEYNGAYESFSENQQDCSPIITGVDVSFILNGSLPRITDVILEDAAMTHVVGVTPLPTLPSMANNACSAPVNSACFNGWSLQRSQNPPCTPSQSQNCMDYHIYMEWHQPAVVGDPPQGCGRPDQECALAIWPGLTVTMGGGTSGNPGYGIAQAGSEDTDTICCGTHYWNAYEWLEFFPDGQQRAPQACTQVIHGNDDLEADAYYDWNGAGHYYYVAAYDRNDGYGCAANSQNTGNGWNLNGVPPVQGNWIVEQNNNYPADKQPIAVVNSFWVNGYTVNTNDLSNSSSEFPPSDHFWWHQIAALSSGNFLPPSWCTGSGYTNPQPSCFEEIWQG